MDSRPRLAIDIFNQYVTQDFGVNWPDDESERSLLARALLGKSLISRFDLAIDNQYALIDGHTTKFEPKANSDLGKIHDYKKKQFNSFSKSQTSFIKKVILDAQFQSFFDVLVRFDQPSDGSYDLVLNLFTSNGESPIPIKLMGNHLDDLHNDLFDWLYSFSKYGNELVELVQNKHSMSFHTKNIFK